MSGRHPDRDVLERFLEGSLHEGEDLAVERHLFTCQACEERLAGLLPDPASLAASPMTDEVYRGLLQRLLHAEEPKVHLRQRLLAQERAEAPALWQEIEFLAPERRRTAVWDDARLQSWGFCELLVDLARQAAPEDARRGEDLARLALDVAEHLNPEEYGPGSVEAAKVRAWAYLGNALRILGDFRQAEHAFHTAELFFFRSWLDPLDEALLMELKAPLRRAQRRFDEALELLEAAIAIYREVNEPHLQGRALMPKGLALQYKGDYRGAADCFRASLLLLDAKREPRLSVMSQYNLVSCLHDAGRNAEAAALIPAARRLMEREGKRADLVRLRWTEGRIAASMGKVTAAEEALQEVRETFLEDGLVFDAALVSLDLAALYLRQHRPVETKRLIEELIPVFQAREVYREVLAAIIVVRQAAEVEQLNAGLIEEVGAYLQQARTDLHLRFRG